MIKIEKSDWLDSQIVESTQVLDLIRWHKQFRKYVRNHFFWTSNIWKEDDLMVVKLYSGIYDLKLFDQYNFYANIFLQIISQQCIHDGWSTDWWDDESLPLGGHSTS